MKPERGYFLESNVVHAFILTAGSALLIIAMVQLPLSVYFQNTKPAIDWWGVSVVKEGVVVTLVERATKGPFAGKLHNGDIATELNGVKLDSAHADWDKMSMALMTLRIGDTVTMKILRDGKPLTVTTKLTVTRGAYLGVNISIVLYLTNNIGPLVTILIAFVIVLRQPRRRLNALFAIASFTISFFLLNSNTLSGYMPWWRIMMPYGAMMNQAALYYFFAMLVHLFCIFPVERTVRKSIGLRNALIYTPATAITFLVVVIIFALKLVEENSAMLTVVIATLVSYLVIAIVLLVRSYRKATSPALKRILSVILIGVSLFAFASATAFALQIFIDSLHSDIVLWIRIAVMITITFSLPISFGYAILRYGFMDVRIIFKQATVYSIMSGMVLASFLGIYLFLDAYGDMFSPPEMLFVSLVISGILLLAITILKDRIQHFVDTKIFRKGYAVEEKLRALARRLLHFLERDALMEHLSRELPAIMDVGTAAIAECRNGSARVLTGSPVPEETLCNLMHNETIRKRLNDGHVVIVNSVPGVQYGEEIQVVFTINASDAGDVVMTLGEKRSGKPFTDEEVEQLRSVADHASLGWRNAVMTEEMKDRERIKKEVEIAQSIQMSMLPHGMPKVEGFDIAAYAVSAREVGGDFYDVIPLGDDALLISVGDVSDKGISAAMVMASSMTALRFAAESFSTPKQILESANRRLFHDTRRQMFVAVCAIVIDTRAMTFTFTNAGLPKPLLYRQGEAFLIDWSENGDHLPLGAKRDTAYHEQTLPLERGDILILYTDGVIESVNENDEEFGVKRLKNSVLAAHDQPSEHILQRIHDDVHSFTGTKALFDDITMVVIKVE